MVKIARKRNDKVGSLGVKKHEIPFIVIMLFVGAAAGFLALPNKECGRVLCEVKDASKGSSFSTSLANAFISSEHLDGLAFEINREQLTPEKIRGGISADVLRDSTQVVFVFAFSNRADTEAVVDGFCSYSISYLNSHVYELRNSLELVSTSFFATDTIMYSILSSAVSGLCFAGTAYCALLAMRFFSKKQGDAVENN